MNILLTGASGYIGSHIAEHLIANNHIVLCTKRNKSNLWRCQTFLNNVQWTSTDEQNWKEVTISFHPQVIIHTAWDGVDATGRGDWGKQISNLCFQQDLLHIAQKSLCKKFIGFGSQAEYGEFSGCIDENYPAQPNSAYGAVKLASLDILRTFCELHQIGWYWFRLFSCFGEREGDTWLIPSAVKNMLRQQSMDVTLGEQKYAYLYIGNVAKVVVATLTTSADSGVYNLSSEHVISIRELLEKIKDWVNPSFDLKFGALPYRAGQPMWVQGTNAKVCTNIQNIDSGNFEEMLSRTVQYYIHSYK